MCNRCECNAYDFNDYDFDRFECDRNRRCDDDFGTKRIERSRTSSSQYNASTL